jgi:hypothetical protein
MTRASIEGMEEFPDFMLRATVFLVIYSFNCQGCFMENKIPQKFIINLFKARNFDYEFSMNMLRLFLTLYSRIFEDMSGNSPVLLKIFTLVNKFSVHINKRFHLFEK